MKDFVASDYSIMVRLSMHYVSTLITFIKCGVKTSECTYTFSIKQSVAPIRIVNGPYNCKCCPWTVTGVPAKKISLCFHHMFIRSCLNERESTYVILNSNFILSIVIKFFIWWLKFLYYPPPQMNRYFLQSIFIFLRTSCLGSQVWLNMGDTKQGYSCNTEIKRFIKILSNQHH